MKAKSIIIAAVLTFFSGFLFAENDNIVSAPVAFESTSIVAMNLSPSTPAEATFEEVATVNDFAFLAPVAPTEVTFEDFAPVASFELVNLAPIVPAEADFNDSADVTINVNALAPVLPLTADFE